jgi:hypothetical protein
MMMVIAMVRHRSREDIATKREEGRPQRVRLTLMVKGGRGDERRGRQLGESCVVVIVIVVVVVAIQSSSCRRRVVVVVELLLLCSWRCVVVVVQERGDRLCFRSVSMRPGARQTRRP